VAPAPGSLFDSPRGSLVLQRYPGRPNETLTAWSAADRLLVDSLTGALPRPETILVANDEHGALSTALGAGQMWTDSALSARALRQNLQRNSLPGIAVAWSTEPPSVATQLVVMRVPKQLAYFEFQLATLAATMSPGTSLVAGGMDKHLSPHTAALIEHYVGPTQRHRGQRKARLFSATFDGPQYPLPEIWRRYHCPALDAELKSLPNVFSREQLDRGSEFLLRQLPHLTLTAQDRAVDLACGNGVLGLAALASGLARRLVFCDESAMALASARENLLCVRPDDEVRCEFHHGDGLLDYCGERAGLVLCNPPFHSQHVVDDFAGRRLLAQAAKHLEADGCLCLVANRHLKYRSVLTRSFHQVETLASNSKFIVWRASRPR